MYFLVGKITLGCSSSVYITPFVGRIIVRKVGLLGMVATQSLIRFTFTTALLILLSILAFDCVVELCESVYYARQIYGGSGTTREHDTQFM